MSTKKCILKGRKPGILSAMLKFICGSKEPAAEVAKVRPPRQVKMPDGAYFHFEADSNRIRFSINHFEPACVRVPNGNYYLRLESIGMIPNLLQLKANFSAWEVFGTPEAQVYAGCISINDDVAYVQFYGEFAVDFIKRSLEPGFENVIYPADRIKTMGAHMRRMNLVELIKSSHQGRTYNNIVLGGILGINLTVKEDEISITHTSGYVDYA